MSPKSSPRQVHTAAERLTVAGLFAGIGGIEVGFHQAGHRTAMVCEIDEGACRVLERRIPGVELHRDVRELRGLPRVDVLAAGFPCQDLSQAGRTAGIRGRNSSLVGQVFRILDATPRRPRWLLLENVSFMLQLDRGRAMRYLVDMLEERGFSWAYRVVDTRAFGLPQRRQRVLLLASKTEDPRAVLFADHEDEEEWSFSRDVWCGFYWTEGLRGLGWAINSVPTLKGGSSVGIPSPPAIWNPRTGEIVTPEIRDAERLQGFPADWTLPALEADGVRPGHRWKLVGNAVSVPVAKWIAKRLAKPGKFRPLAHLTTSRGLSWPRAAWGYKGDVFAVDATMWPVRQAREDLADFLQFPLTPLSARAASGFLSRARVSSLTFEDGFLEAIDRHIARMTKLAVA
jgi:DNA (cytosine-5)-methyltransferase 1